MRISGIAAIAFMAAASVRAGVIQGIVIEHISGLPMARSQVRLDLIASSGFRQAAAMITARSGQYVFQNIPDGYYVVSAIRESYHVTYYGERRPGGSGAAISVTRDSNHFGELRLRHLGAITGRVLDENRVALPNLPVLAYPLALPLRSVASGKSDDRGVFRIPNLPPGKYYVRTGPHQLTGAGVIPTFSPENPQAKDSRIMTVRLDGDSTDADVAPIFGTLLRAAGRVICSPLGTPITVTISSEIGRSNYDTACGGGFTIEGLPPGGYELLAVIKSPEPSLAGFLEIQVNRDPTLVTIQPDQIQPLGVVIKERDGGAVPADVSVIARRVDMAGVEAPKTVRGAALFAPGYWEVNASLPPNYYVANIRIGLSNRTRRGGDRVFHPDWFGVYADQRFPDKLEVTISAKGGRLAGIVTDHAELVVGAPVHLWPVTPEARRGTNGPKIAYTDSKGAYSFQGLAPGEYLLLGSYDYTTIDEDLLAEANAQPLRIADGQTAVKDLSLYTAGK